MIYSVADNDSRNFRGRRKFTRGKKKRVPSIGVEDSRVYCVIDYRLMDIL